MKYAIKDWAGNVCFNRKEFDSFQDAWGFLYETFPEDEEELQEYKVIRLDGKFPPIPPRAPFLNLKG